MRYRALTILAGIAALAGGVLRIVAIFTTSTFAPQTLAWFYFLIDVLLMLGLVGWYVPRADRLGGIGLIGFVTAASAILLIRSAGLLGADTYQAGATLLAAGLAVVSAAALWRRDKPLLAPILWLLCLASGIVALAFKQAAIAAFVLFGLGYIAAGVELLRQR